MTLEATSNNSAFHHMIVSNHPSMIESCCAKCMQFIAASTRVGMVEAVESLHSCADPILAVRKPMQTTHS